MISRAVEDYLKVIYELSAGDRRVSTSQMAKRMKCSPASVTSMLRKLSALKLVQYTPYKGVKLTSAGIKVSLEIVRHHRLLELYLSEILGYSWDKVHAEADELEHVISEEFEKRIDEALGHPLKDPHGDPIPSVDGTIEKNRHYSLWEVPVGQRIKIERVSDRNPEVLRYLSTMGIYPGVWLQVIKTAPFGGPISVKIGDKVHLLSEELGCQIYVSPALSKGSAKKG
jgi:DtxR family Mn-dependent transcriptional regulator